MNVLLHITDVLRTPFESFTVHLNKIIHGIIIGRSLRGDDDARSAPYLLSLAAFAESAEATSDPVALVETT